MDPIDRHIVSLLQTQGRLSQEQIARQVGLSRPAVHERIKRLEAQAVIRGYSAQVDWSALGLPLTAFISVGLDLTPCAQVAARIRALNTTTGIVSEIHRITGEWCLLAKVRTTDTQALQQFLDKLRTVPGVTSTMTNIVLSTLNTASLSSSVP